jgi:hypothetical protein
MAPPAQRGAALSTARIVDPNEEKAAERLKALGT